MKIKDGVNVSGLRPEMLVAITAAQDIWRKHGHELTITSALDGRHSRGSLHYVGLALDFRTRDMPGDAATLSHALRAALGAQYDVVLESNHLHVEFQPKEPL